MLFRSPMEQVHPTLSVPEKLVNLFHGYSEADAESIMDGDDFTVKKIAKEFDYRRIAQAYVDMDEDEE